MIIKKRDDRTNDLAALEALARHPDATGIIRNRIADEIRNIRAGIAGEKDAGYQIDFYFGADDDRMVIHDLRLEFGDRVAQIDHLIVNRSFRLRLCESKTYGRGITITEDAQFLVHSSDGTVPVPSPIEQNNRHRKLIEDMLAANAFPSPRNAFGTNLKPDFETYVLIATRSAVRRPKRAFPGLDTVIKSDQIGTKIEENIDKISLAKTLLTAATARIMSRQACLGLAHEIAALHKPAKYDWAAKFGLSPSTPAVPPVARAAQISIETSAQRKPATCDSCGTSVPPNVVQWCLDHARKFSGRILCRSCQAAPAPAPASPSTSPQPATAPIVREGATAPAAATALADGQPTRKLNATCVDCGSAVDDKVIHFCRFNAKRFLRRPVCKVCQPKYPPL